ncbi:MAG: DUF4249 domain-containing protein [Algoriphagus sp.]|uniref:DUF4249 domain-containing protein n=1 Tax=Algoriphagus sp. TaxID=1872435 RepID=UPI00261D0AB1|nr:DUF4249 domain-containing protein [Algoriphagus sp.]MDG1278825.1 DUF4249 domain-containing protein [Algoriphagus sp.]
MRRIQLVVLFCFSILIGCREPFEPEIEATDLNVLVVEGYLDSEGLPSVLDLSYTRNIQDEFSSNSKVFGANVYLESSGGERFGLVELGNGSYEFKHDIPESDTYVLRIFLPDGTSYSSTQLTPLITPDIIDVGFEKNEAGVEIFLTTKGNSEADDFLWTFDETWQFRPAITSQVKYDPEVQDVVLRTPDERIDLCYLSKRNSDLILETSSRFEDQFVFRQTINQINQGDERLTLRYSILISQKALTKDASEFWEILKKNTDDLGSIFSPLPSIVTGNMTQDQNPNVPVIGQVGLGKVQQRRLFIDIRDVAPWRAEVPEYENCLLSADTVLIRDYDSRFRSGVNIPALPIYPENAFNPIGYRYSSLICVDCTQRGSNVKPDFWVD